MENLEDSPSHISYLLVAQEGYQHVGDNVGLM